MSDHRTGGRMNSKEILASLEKTSARINELAAKMPMAQEEADVAPFTEVYNAAMNAQARIRELEAQLAESEREREIERLSKEQLMIAADAASQAIRALEAQLAILREDSNMQAARAEAAKEMAQNAKRIAEEESLAAAAELDEVKAENAKLRAVVDAAVDWADAFPGYEAGAFGSSAYLKAREQLLRATVREYRQAALSPRQTESEEKT